MRRLNENGNAILHHELMQEMAFTLGRLGRELETRIEALRRFDESPAAMDDARKAERHALISAASLALWHFVVQRETCGLRDTTRMMKDYKVPPEVRTRMGAFL